MGADFTLTTRIQQYPLWRIYTEKNKLHRTIANNTAVKKDLLFKLHRVFDQLHALVEQAHDSVLQLPYNPSYGGNCNGKS